MKKNILRLGLVTLFVIFCALLMPETTFAASIEKIEITVPEPVIGEKLTTDKSKIQVKTGDNQGFEIDEIRWACDEYSISTNQYLGYKEVNDYNKTCNNIDKYKLQLSFWVPNTYTPSSTLVITVNGIAIDTQNIEELNWGSHGDTNNDGVFVCFEFGKAKAQREISKIEITTPTLVAGEKLITDISEFEVKIDGTEILNIIDVEWLSEDFKTLSSDIAESGKKYNVAVGFNVPNKYSLSSDIIVTVNGEKINVNNLDEFNYGSSGDLNFDYTGVTKLMDVKEVSREEPKENSTEQPKEEIKGESTTEETKKDETPKTGINSYIIVATITAIISLYAVIVINKKNK